MKVFVTRKLPGFSQSEFEREKIEVLVSSFDRPLTQEELIEKAKGVDAIISLLTDKIDGDVMDAIGPGLKVIANYAVGFDNINVDDATKRGIVVVNSSCDEVNLAVAEHTWALILSLARRIVEADESVRRGSYSGWDPGLFLGKSLSGKVLGIVGLGRIGSMVAQRAKGYQMKILYNKHERDIKAEESLGVEFSEIENLYKTSDFVSLHVPLTPETLGMINKESLSKMKKGSYLINTARGGCVVEDDLVEALRSGQIAGAALDVFENEPNIHPELIGMQNVILTPHIASATFEARAMMAKICIDAVCNTFSGKKPQNIVNETVWDTRRK